MALSREQSVHTYSSSSGGTEYLFDVVVDSDSLVSVRNMRTPLGLIMDSYTSLPQAVIDDMTDAVSLVTLLQQETEADSGTLVFSGDTSVAATIASGVLNNTNYRVEFTTSDGTVIVAESKTILGFDAVAAAAFGSPTSPETVTYSVLVKTAQTSDLSGVATIADTDAGELAIVFTTALDTTAYRVLLEPRGFFVAGVPEATKLKTGFTIKLGHVPPTGESVTVGYDVFV